MDELLNVHTLIWLFPIMFVLHDLEEIIMVERWLDKNVQSINNKLPKKIADKVIKQLSITTPQFTLADLVIFLFVSSSTYMASQYIHQGPLGNIHFYIVVMLVFFLHVFTHIGQSLLLRSITPGVITSIFVVLPYSLLVFNSLLKNNIITWDIILFCTPFIVLIVPVLLFSLWLGKKVV